ncbi:hypothetical protein CgunFtcFv8_013078 [Champsocephalus gunnari]|uniref:Uncharacterized protein n=1 Tax=Champsocephalus gunnari TaxID=52237 RepID=A0AAN8DRV6_CHAGU|nr:hypothetical protein CgunFtcFv8_013078 [Champsocephalus gunnari]
MFCFLSSLCCNVRSEVEPTQHHPITPSCALVLFSGLLTLPVGRQPSEPSPSREAQCVGWWVQRVTSRHPRPPDSTQLCL